MLIDIGKTTTNIIETKEIFKYNGLLYLRVYKVTDGKVDRYWSNVSENHKNTNYNFYEWDKHLKTVIKIYNRKMKFKRLLENDR